MIDFVAPTSLPQAQEQAESTTSTPTFHRFMELPFEIRLLVYDELILQNRDLYRARCYSCLSREQRYFIQMPGYYANVECTQTFRISKQICSEMLPLFYSKNTFHLSCLECGETGYLLWACQTKPQNFLTENIGQHHRHVRNINIAFKANETRDSKPYDRIKEFPVRWAQMEHQLLARYQNSERISVRIPYYYVDVTVDLVRRSGKYTTGRVHDYKSVLARRSAYCLEYKEGPFTMEALEDSMPTLATLEEICDVIILSNAQGHLKDTVFAVQSIRCKPLSEPRKKIVLHLGCDKHSASDMLIKEILANTGLQDEMRWIEAEALKDVAAASDTSITPHMSASG